MKYPNYIRKYREAAGFRPKDIYVKMGWDQTRFSHVENGNRKLQFKDAEAMALIIGCSPESLFTGKEETSAVKESSVVGGIDTLINFYNKARDNTLTAKELQNLKRLYLAHVERYKAEHGCLPTVEEDEKYLDAASEGIIIQRPTSH